MPYNSQFYDVAYPCDSDNEHVIQILLGKVLGLGTILSMRLSLKFHTHERKIFWQRHEDMVSPFVFFEYLFGFGDSQDCQKNWEDQNGFSHWGDSWVHLVNGDEGASLAELGYDY